MAKEAMKLIANNKKAYHDFFIEEKPAGGYHKAYEPDFGGA